MAPNNSAAALPPHIPPHTHLLDHNLGMMGDGTASESPMASNFGSHKHFPSSKDWSPFIKYGNFLDETDLAFLNSPTPRAGYHPAGAAAGANAVKSDLPPPHPPQAAHQQFWHAPSNLPQYNTDDLLAVQSARLLSNKMALQDRLKHNNSSSSSSSQMISAPTEYSAPLGHELEGSEIPMILSKRPKIKQNRPKVKPGQTGAFINYSAEELASPGLAAIANAAKDLSPQNNFRLSEGRETDDMTNKARKLEVPVAMLGTGYWDGSAAQNMREAVVWHVTQLP
jgi:hypothetical protein